MKTSSKMLGFFPYISIVFLNATVDLGHKIILQNSVFKSYSGSELIIYTAIINSLILLPFIFLLSPSGFLSDRYNKTKIVRFASLLAIVITTLITVCYYQGWFVGAFCLTLVLAAQSAIYSPAKYGLIKELFGVKNIGSINGIAQAVTIVSILLGALIYSYFFEILLNNQTKDQNEILTYIAPLGFVLIASSLIEFLLALKLPVKNNGNAQLVFSVKKYATLHYFHRNSLLLKRDSTIWYSMIGLAFFWSMSQIIVAVFGAFLKHSSGVDSTIVVQGMLAVGGAGIVVGSLIAGYISKRHIETALIPIGALGIATTLAILPHLSDLFSIGLLFFTYGVFAGMFIVPLNSLIQFSAPSSKLGKVLATNNCYQNVAMLTALIITAYLSYLGLNIKYIFTAVALVAVFCALFVIYKLPQSLIRYLVKIFLSFKYRVDVEGLENIPDNKGVLLLGNHISYLDWAILQIAYPKQIQFVMEKSIYKNIYIKRFLDFFKVIPISKGASKYALSTVTKALNEGRTVAFFPEGYLSRNSHINPFLKGYELAINSTENTVIVPFYLHGLWQSPFSYASKKIQSEANNISVHFGKALPHTTKANEVRAKVIELSMGAWERDINSHNSIGHYWLGKIKHHQNFFVADSTGLKLSNIRFLAGTLIIRAWLKKSIKNETNIGVILPSSVAGSMVNMALQTLSKTVVNLNYTVATSLNSAIEQAEIKTIITSTTFIKKLTEKGIVLAPTLVNCNVVYLEDMKGFAHKPRSLSYYLLAKLCPTWLLQQLFSKKTNINTQAVILFSSGSEATPKGIVLSHKNIIGNIKQIKTVLNPTDNDVLIGTLPTFHSFGLSVCTILPQLEGIAVAYHPDPTDACGVGKLTAEYSGSILLGTATFLRLYVRNKKCHPLMFNSLRKVVAGAERLPDDVRESFKQKFGLDIYEGYGTTETSPVVSCNMPDYLIEKYWKLQIGQKIGTVGMALGGTKIIIVDPNTFIERPVGEEGMVAVSGVQVMQGYLNNPIKTATVIKIINQRQYYITGDKGSIDESGFLTIIDRYSRFAKIGGEMVSLRAIEEQIEMHITHYDIEIELCAVAMVDDKKGEQVIVLYRADIEPQVLKDQLIKSKMQPLYIPNRLFLVDELPKLGTGKTDFNGVKKLAQQLIGESI